MCATPYFQDQSQINNLAIQLLDLFCENGIEYFPPYESWFKRKNDVDNTWRAIAYTEVVEFAILSLNVLTKKKPTPKLAKKVLIKIEQWMIQSNGQLAQVKFDNGEQSWLPVCLLA